MPRLTAENPQLHLAPDELELLFPNNAEALSSYTWEPIQTADCWVDASRPLMRAWDTVVDQRENGGYGIEEQIIEIDRPETAVAFLQALRLLGSRAIRRAENSTITDNPTFLIACRGLSARLTEAAERIQSDPSVIPKTIRFSTGVPLRPIDKRGSMLHEDG